MKRLKIKFCLLTLMVIVLSSCAKKESITEPKNGMTINGAFHPFETLWIHDENMDNNVASDIGFRFFNISDSEIQSGVEKTGVTQLYFDILDTSLKQKMYSEVLDYKLEVNGKLENLKYTNGTVLLFDEDLKLHASSTTVSIEKISGDQIELNFSFVRKDGQTYSGYYKGKFVKRD